MSKAYCSRNRARLRRRPPGPILRPLFQAEIRRPPGRGRLTRRPPPRLPRGFCGLQAMLVIARPQRLNTARGTVMETLATPFFVEFDSLPTRPPTRLRRPIPILPPAQRLRQRRAERMGVGMRFVGPRRNVRTVAPGQPPPRLSVLLLRRMRLLQHRRTRRKDGPRRIASSTGTPSTPRCRSSARRSTRVSTV
jgi:hypothetical protein